MVDFPTPDLFRLSGTLGLPDITPGFNPAAPQPGQANILEQILGSNPQQTAQPQEPTRAPRKRASILDIIGRAGDTLAVAGEGEPLYQQSIDAQTARERQEQMDELNRRAVEQGLQAGEIEIGSAKREQIGQALAGIIGSENPAADWMAIAQQAGIPPDKAAAIGAEIQRNPNAVEQLATAFGYSPRSQGSLPKELQIFELLQQRDPAKAEQYLNSLVQGGQMTPYQMAQLMLGQERNDLAREKFENPQPSASERKAATERERELTGSVRGFSLAKDSLRRLRSAYERLGRSGGINSPEQTGEENAVAAAYQYVPLLERVVSGDGFSARQEIDNIINNVVLETLPLITVTKLGSRSFDAASELDFHKLRVASQSDLPAALEGISALERKLDSFRKAAEEELRGGSSSSRDVRGGQVNPELEAELRRRGLRP